MKSKKDIKRHIGLRVEVSLLERVVKLADKRGQNFSECLRDAIEAGVERLQRGTEI